MRCAAMRSQASPMTSPVVRSAIFGRRGRISLDGPELGTRRAVADARVAGHRHRRHRLDQLRGQGDHGVRGGVSATGDHHVGLTALDGRGGVHHGLAGRRAGAADGSTPRPRAPGPGPARPRDRRSGRGRSTTPPHTTRSTSAWAGLYAPAALGRPTRRESMASSFMSEPKERTKGVRFPATITARRPSDLADEGVWHRSGSTRLPPQTRRTLPERPWAPGEQRKVRTSATSMGRPPWRGCTGVELPRGSRRGSPPSGGFR